MTSHTFQANIYFRGKENKAFRHVETLFVQGNQVRTESKQTSFFGKKKRMFVLIQYEHDNLGRIKFLQVEMPYLKSTLLINWKEYDRKTVFLFYYEPNRI